MLSVKTQLIVGLGVYLACTVPVVAFTPDIISGDGPCYVLQGEYLLSGSRFWLGVSAYWSPAYSVVTGLLQIGGATRLQSLQLANILCGGLLFVSAALLLRSVFLSCYDGPSALAWGAQATIALFCAAIALREQTPDMLLAATLYPLAYCWCLHNPPRGDFRAGVLIGFAFLVKAFAVPFGCAFFVVWCIRDGVVARGIAAAAVFKRLLRFVTGILCVALPWMIVLSLQYGKPTWSSVSPVVFAAIAPNVEFGSHADKGLMTPAKGKLSHGQDPDKREFVPWSPFSSVADATHYAKVLKRNMLRLRRTILDFDLVGMSLLIAALTPLLIIQERQLWTAAKLQACVIFIFITLLGYLPTFVIARYILTPLFCMVFVTGLTVATRLRRPSIVTAVIVVTFFTGALSLFVESVRGRLHSDDAWKRIIAVTQKHDLQAPIAATEWDECWKSAFVMDWQCLGTTLPADWDTEIQELNDSAARTFVVCSRWQHASRIDIPGWEFVDSWQGIYGEAWRVYRR